MYVTPPYRDNITFDLLKRARSVPRIPCTLIERPTETLFVLNVASNACNDCLGDFVPLTPLSTMSTRESTAKI